MPQRVKTLLWAIHHGKIMTNKERVHRGFTMDLYCKECPKSIEDIDHIFRFTKSLRGFFYYGDHTGQIGGIQHQMGRLVTFEAWLGNSEHIQKL